MTTTLRDTPTTLGDLAGDGPVWSLLIVHHPTRALVGVRRVLLADSHVTLGRDGDALGPGGLADARLSRQHAEVRAAPGGTLHLRDLGSSNGTWVNGRPVERADLDVDDVVRVGSLLLVVQRGPARLVARTRGPVPTLGGPMAGVLSALEALPAGRVVACWAEADTGVDDLAEWLHRRDDTGGPLVRCDADSIPASAAGATVLIGPLGDFRDASLAAKVGGLQRSARRVVAWAEVASQHQEAHALDADPAWAALDALAVRIPPLRERAADLPVLVDRYARRHHGAPIALHHQLATAMLLAPWPGNLRQLEAFVRDRLRPGADPARWDPAFADELGPLPTATREAPEPPARHVRVARDGTWFDWPDAPRVTLHPRRSLVNLLAALASHLDAPLSTADLIHAGWPGEQPVGASGATRVYVALSTLRKLGLRDALRREGDGYCLGGPNVSLELVDASAAD